MSDEKLTTLPVLPIKNTVLFPYLLMPLAVGRAATRAAVESTLATEDKTLLVVAQRDANVEEPGEQDLYTIGTRAIIKKAGRSDNGLELIVQGVERVAILRLTQTTPFVQAVVRPLPLPEDTGTEVEALHRAVMELATRALALAQPQTPFDVGQLLAQTRDPIQVVYLLGSMLTLDLQKEQALLEAPTRLEALRLMHTYLSHEVQV